MSPERDRLIADLKEEIRQLKRRAVEDRRFAEERIELALKDPSQEEIQNLHQQITDLTEVLAEEDAMIDRIVIFLRLRNTD